MFLKTKTMFNSNKMIEALYKQKLYSAIYHYFTELRLRFSYLLFSFSITFFACYYYSLEIIYIFARPFLSYEKNFIFTDLTEAFYTTIQTTFIFSLCILVPFIIYHIWCFCIPSKFCSERKKFTFLIIFFFFLFIISLIFVYSFLLPKLYQFFLNFEINTNIISIQLEARIHSYIKLAFFIFFFSSLFFEIPLIFFLLLEYKLVTITFLSLNRAQAFFCNILLSAFLCPPDAYTQILMAGFFQFIFEILLLLGSFYSRYTLNKQSLLKQLKNKIKT